jgi:hypothetical protein
VSIDSTDPRSSDTDGSVSQGVLSEVSDSPRRASQVYHPPGPFANHETMAKASSPMPDWGDGRNWIDGIASLPYLMHDMQNLPWSASPAA